MITGSRGSEYARKIIRYIFHTRGTTEKFVLVDLLDLKSTVMLAMQSTINVHWFTEATEIILLGLTLSILEDYYFVLHGEDYLRVSNISFFF